MMANPPNHHYVTGLTVADECLSSERERLVSIIKDDGDDDDDDDDYHHHHDHDDDIQ